MSSGSTPLLPCHFLLKLAISQSVRQPAKPSRFLSFSRIRGGIVKEFRIEPRLGDAPMNHDTVRNRDASNPVALLISRSASSKPSSPYG